MLFKFRFQRRKPFCKIEIIFVIRQADIAAGRDDVVQGLDFVDRRRLTESLHVFVFLIGIAPVVVRARDKFDVIFGEFPRAPIDQKAVITRVNE